jgi:precorrin-6A synthase
VRRLLVIGIGAGDPDFVTVGAVDALNRVDVFLVLDKGPATKDLTAARRAVCERFITHDRWRIVELSDPERDRSSGTQAVAGRYVRAVDGWSGVTRPSTTARSASSRRSPRTARSSWTGR